ncbi:MAG: class I SAM-dependent methyltransferase [Terriglobales bacterium]
MSSTLNAGLDLQARSGGKLFAVDDSCSVSAAEGYERWAPVYDDVPNPLLAREERYLLPMLTDVKSKSVFDVACGTGRWLEKVVALGCATGVGIDRSAAMLRVARNKSAIRQRLVEGDCEKLPFPDAVFDVAICSFALGHIEKLGAMVRELARVMRGGAEVFVSDLHPEAYALGWRTGFRNDGTAVQIEMRPRSVAEIVREFCANGFEWGRQVSLWLGEPEEPVFARAGKLHSFTEACRVPAVFVCQFRRLAELER